MCTPTFVTPNIVANAALQKYILRGTPIFYFFAPGATHILDFLMQSLWNETQYQSARGALLEHASPTSSARARR